MDVTKTIITSTRNFLKIYNTGSATKTIGTTSGTPTSILLYTHNLGYIPRVKVWYEPVAGELWPLVINQYSNLDGGPGTTIYVYGYVKITTSAVYAVVHNDSGSSQNVPFKWRVYLDE